MRFVLIHIAFSFSLFACVQHKDDDQELELFDRLELDYSVKYAEGFNLEQTADGLIISTYSLNENADWSDELIAPYRDDHDFAEESKFIHPNIERICCQSSTHLAFIDKLEQMRTVVGLCGLEYVANQKLVDQLRENKAVEICIGDNNQAEEILTQDPDLYFVYPFESENVADLEAQGVKTFMIAEYLESDPLARLEWIKVFGVIFDAYREAVGYFDRVESLYNVNKISQRDPEKTFFMNLPFGDSWNSPSSHSLIVNLCKDAGFTYHFKDEEGTENVVRSKEEMWEVGTQVPYWIIVASRPADFDLDDLLAEEEVYKTFKSVKDGNVIFCNTATTDYFTYGILEPQIMLKELSRIMQGSPLARSKYFHLLN